MMLQTLAIGALLASLGILPAPPYPALPFQDEATEKADGPGVPAVDYEPAGCVLPVEDPAALRAELAEAMVEARTSGDARRALDTLERIWIAASCNHPFEGQRALLLQVVTERSELLRSQGRLEEARQTTTQLLPDLLDTHYANHVSLAPASASLLAVIASLMRDPLLNEVRIQLVEQLEGEAGADEMGEESLHAVIDGVIARQNWNLVSDLGARAIPYLLETILRDPDSFPPSSGADPLSCLIGLGEQRVAMDLAANLDAGGYLWRRRIMRAMRRAQVMSNSGTWAAANSDGSGVICLEPGWLDILAVLLRTPDTARDCLPLVHEVVRRGALTPVLEEGLKAALDSGEPDLPPMVMQILSHDHGVYLTEKGILEHMARGTDALVRKFAAKKLTQFGESDALLELASDPDPEIRGWIAQTLVNSRVVHRAHGRTDGQYRFVEERISRTPGERERDAMSLLLHDNDPEVRVLSIPAAMDMHGLLPEAAYQRLAKDESAEVRIALAGHVHELPDSLGAPLLCILADDADPRVRGAVDEMLADPKRGAGRPQYIEVLVQRLTHRDHSAAGAAKRKLVEEFCRLQDNVVPLARHALKSGADNLLSLLFYAAGDRLLSLDDPLLADFTLRLARQSREDALRFLDRYVRNEDFRPGALRIVLQDGEAPAELRAEAAVGLAFRGGEELRASLLQLIATPEGEEAGSRTERHRYLEKAVRALPDHERNAFLLEVVRNGALPDALGATLVGRYQPEQPLGKEITLRILARWFDAPGVAGGVVSTAIEHLGVLPPNEVDPKILIAAARIPAYAYVAVHSMGRLRGEVYLECLGRCLTADWISSESLRKTIRMEAAQALTGYFSDEAAEHLLAGMQTSDGNVRSACSAGLSTIEDYQQRTREWANRSAPKRTPDDAVTELAAMLEDSDPLLRAEAVRGLATLGAVEYIPVLIRMMRGDAEEAVRTAAKAALDRLNEPPAPKEDPTPRGGEKAESEEG